MDRAAAAPAGVTVTIRGDAAVIDELAAAGSPADGGIVFQVTPRHAVSPLRSGR